MRLEWFMYGLSYHAVNKARKLAEIAEFLTVGRLIVIWLIG